MNLPSSIICLASLLLSACAHAPPPASDGSRGTRVTNPRVAPWAFFRGDTALFTGERTEAGDVLETQCAHGACTAEHRFVTVWIVSDGRLSPATRGSVKTRPDRERRIALPAGAEFAIVAWSRTPLDEVPRIDLQDDTRKGPHSQALLHDDDGEQVGVVQWGPVDEVR